MNEAAVALILTYMEDCLFEPGPTWPKFEFYHRSCSRWAANEILELIISHPNTCPLSLIEAFIIKMGLFACRVEKTRSSFMFLVARDAAEDVLLLFSSLD